MSIVKQIKKLHNLSDATVQTRLSKVRTHYKMMYFDEVSLEQYLTLFSK